MKRIRLTAGLAGIASVALVVAEVAVRAVLAYRRWLWEESRAHFET
jgi:hypothetical protein